MTKPDPLILDAPLWYHAPKLLLWCAFQGTVITEAVLLLQGVSTCFSCHSGSASRVQRFIVCHTRISLRG